MLTIYTLFIKVIITILNKMPCSFCGQHGHTITNCVSQEIEVIYNRLLNIYIQIKDRYGDMYDNIGELFDFNRNICERTFKSEVNRMFGLRELRAVAVRYTTIRASSHKSELIHYMWLHFSYGTHTGLRIHTPAVPQFTIHVASNVIPIIPDNIPAFAQDLDANFTNTWNIDRTPEYINTINWINSSRGGLAFGFVADFGYETPAIVREIERERRERRKINISIDLSEETETELTEEETENMECPICYETILKNNEVKLNCCHQFCCSCIKKSLNSYNNQTCALCRTQTTTYSVKNIEMYNVIAEYNV